MSFHLADGVARRTSTAIAERSNELARALGGTGVRPGDRVGLLGPNRPEWVEWAYGIWRAGAALVPLPVPMRVRDPSALAEIIGGIARAAGCATVVADPMFAGLVPGSVVWDDPPPMHGPPPEPVAPDAVAVVQFTSGSTSEPKGVVLTHRAVVAERLTALEAHRIEPGSVAVGWEPYFHDLGLFSFAVLPASFGIVTHVLPTERFAADPSEWFRLVGATGATHIGGPPSSYAAAMRAAARRPDGIRLGTLRMALLGAETVEPELADGLASRGERFGLDPASLVVGYGMAEHVLCIATSPIGGGITCDEVDPSALASAGRAEPLRGGKRVVSCGFPHRGVELKVVGEHGRVLDSRYVGELFVRGPGLLSGYVGADDALEDGWLRTGDLGYLAGHELFVTGRVKDVVIVGGHNFHPEDFEWAAGRVPGVRAGRCVAFSRPDGGGIVLLVEPAAGEDPASLERRVRNAVSDAVGLHPDRVAVLEPGTVLKTTSGKVRRAAMRDAFLAGELEPVGGKEA